MLIKCYCTISNKFTPLQGRYYAELPVPKGAKGGTQKARSLKPCSKHVMVNVRVVVRMAPLHLFIGRPFATHASSQFRFRRTLLRAVWRRGWILPDPACKDRASSFVDKQQARPVAHNSFSALRHQERWTFLNSACCARWRDGCNSCHRQPYTFTSTGKACIVRDRSVDHRTSSCSQLGAHCRLDWAILKEC